MTEFDATAFLAQDEGQHFDRKSLWERSASGARSPRERRAVRDQVARFVAGFANAEGGVLILGIEDDGSVTGHGYPAEARDAILAVPTHRLKPALAPGFVVAHEGHELLVFDVQVADVPVMVVGDGFPLRMGDHTVQVAERQIAALKTDAMGTSWEARASEAALGALDAELLERARQGAGLASLSDEAYLLRRKVADRRGRGIQLRRAAELCFAKDGADHPNAGVRLFRVVGTERRHGAEHNVEERPRLEGPLPQVIDETMQAVSQLLRRPARLVGTKFQPHPEYPDFSWKEAILNAVAHRDYAQQGRSVEVWLYDDRMEVLSPGGLLKEVSLEQLRQGERIHFSRNPRLTRALVDLGYMRDQGEGIPRMFAEMEGSFLPPPVLEEVPHGFSVRLQNTLQLTPEDRAFIGQLGDANLSPQEFRALFEAWRHGRVDNARMRTITGLDTLGASQVLRRLRDQELLALHPAGSASYYTLDGRLQAAATDRGELAADRGELQLAGDGQDLPPNRRDRTSKGHNLGPEGHNLQSEGHNLGPEGHNLGSEGHNLAELPARVQALLADLGPRPRSPALREAISALTELGFWTAQELAQALGGRGVRKLVRNHLSPMCEAGALVRRFPEDPNHPRQAYRAARPGGEKA